MKRMLMAWLIGLAGATSICSGQSVTLKVAPLETSRLMIGTAHGRSETRSQTIKITTMNMHSNTVDCVVEWFFLGRPAAGGGKSSVYDAGKKNIQLAKGKFDSAEVESQKIQATYGGAETTGLKTDGYVVVVWAGDKIVAVDASEMTNRRKYVTASEVNKLEESYRTATGKDIAVFDKDAKKISPD